MARILIGDDNRDLTRTVARVLTGLGHEVETAANGADVIFQVRDKPVFDLLILDLNMPVMGGEEVIERLGPSSPPVILWTAHLEAGGTDHNYVGRGNVKRFITKPFESLENLLSVIDGVLYECRKSGGVS